MWEAGRLRFRLRVGSSRLLERLTALEPCFDLFGWAVGGIRSSLNFNVVRTQPRVAKLLVLRWLIGCDGNEGRFDREREVVRAQTEVYATGAALVGAASRCLVERYLPLGVERKASISAPKPMRPSP